MIKKLSIIILVLAATVMVLIWRSQFLFNEAFDPKSQSYEIQLEDSKALLCEETYNADFHRIYYDVEFILKVEDNFLEMGIGYFTNELWQNQIIFQEIDNWNFLGVKDHGYLKILIVNPGKKIQTDTVFSPLTLRYDYLWNKKYDQIPSQVYYGSSKLDSIRENWFFVNYQYRIGNVRPFDFFSQTIRYEFDLSTGQFITGKVFERIKIDHI